MRRKYLTCIGGTFHGEALACNRGEQAIQVMARAPLLQPAYYRPDVPPEPTIEPYPTEVYERQRWAYRAGMMMPATQEFWVLSGLDQGTAVLLTSLHLFAQRQSAQRSIIPTYDTVAATEEVLAAIRDAINTKPEGRT